jgi:hypothetical protein
MVDLLEQIDDGRAAIVENEQGVVELQFGSPAGGARNKGVA